MEVRIAIYIVNSYLANLFAISHDPATHAKIIFHFSHIVTNAQQRWSIHNIVLSILAKQVDGVGEAIESHKKDSLIQQKPGTSSEPASSSSSFSYTSARGTQQFIKYCYQPLIL